MQNQREEWKRWYDELVQGRMELRSASPDERARLQEHFANLFKEAEASLGEGPAGPHGQELAGRYAELLRKLRPTGDFDVRLQKLVAVYLSPGEWPADAAEPQLPFRGRQTWEFMAKALAARHSPL